jgi:hypothetical protein
MRNVKLALAIAILLLPFAYAASYLVIVALRGIGTVRTAQGTYSARGSSTAYRLGGETVRRFYWPLEQVDRRFRPKEWDHGDLIRTVDTKS